MEDKKERIQGFADQLKTFLPLIDMFMEYDIDELKEWIENMKDDINNKESIWVMFDLDALEKADILKLKVDVFEKLIDLIEVRKKQRDKEPEIQSNIWKRSQIAKELWL